MSLSLSSSKRIGELAHIATAAGTSKSDIYSISQCIYEIVQTYKGDTLDGTRASSLWLALHTTASALSDDFTISLALQKAAERLSANIVENAADEIKAAAKGQYSKDHLSNFKKQYKNYIPAVATLLDNVYQPILWLDWGLKLGQDSSDEQVACLAGEV